MMQFDRNQCKMNKICRHGKKLRNVKRHFHWEEGGLSLAHPLTKPLANMAWLRRLLFLDSLMMDLTFLGRNFSKRDLNQGCLSLLPPPPPAAAAANWPAPPASQRLDFFSAASHLAYCVGNCSVGRRGPLLPKSNFVLFLRLCQPELDWAAS